MTLKNGSDVPRGADIEDHNRDFVVTAKGDRRGVHDPEFFFDDVFVRNTVVPRCCGIELRVGGIDAVNA